MCREGDSFSLPALSHVPRGNSLARKSSPHRERKCNSVSDRLTNPLSAPQRDPNSILLHPGWQNRDVLEQGRKSGLRIAPHTAGGIVVHSDLLYRQTQPLFATEEGINSCWESLVDFISFCSRYFHLLEPAA